MDRLNPANRRGAFSRDAVFRALLRKPTFAWERDGQELLRRRKARHFAHEPLPSFTPVGARLAQLVRKQARTA